jgi:hypothetical protein
MNWTWKEDSILNKYSKYTPCNDIFKAVCDEIGRYFIEKGYKYSSSRPKIALIDNDVKIEVSFYSSRSNIPGDWVAFEICISVISLEYIKYKKEQGEKTQGRLFGEMALFSKKLENVTNGMVRIKKIFGEDIERIEDDRTEPELKIGKTLNVYGITTSDFLKLIDFLEKEVFIWTKKIDDKNEILKLINSTGKTGRWALKNSDFRDYLGYKYADFINEFDKATNR